MKWTSATALVLALGAAGVGVNIVMNRRPRTPQEVIEAIRAEIDEATFDEATAIRQLDRALDGADGDDATMSQLLRLRADLYADLANFGKARADLERLSSLQPTEDPALIVELAELQAKEDKPEEALERARTLITRHPEYGPGWELAGKLEETVAFKAVDGSREIARIGLTTDDARRAAELIEQLTARDVEDPTKADLTYQLGQLFRGFREADLDEILERMGAPRQSFARARAAYARALGFDVDPGTVVRLADSFERAGRSDLAIQLGHAARVSADVARDPEAAAALLGDLIDEGRLAEARRILKDWDWQDGGSVEFYRSAGEVFYKAGQYAALEQAGNGLAMTSGDLAKRWAYFFTSVWPIKAPIGAGASQRRLDSLASFHIPRLQDFARDDLFNEPFIGAKEDAWFLVAEAYRLLGSLSNERIALRKALTLKPDASADAWIRYAETLRAAERVKSWAEIELALTNAMNLAPERTEVLREQWLEAGIKALDKRGTTLDAILDQVSRHDTTLPLAQWIGPSIMNEVARYHLRNGRPYRAITAAKKAMENHPDLIPPRDVQIEAELEDQERFNVARSIVERIELAGIDDQVEEFMTRLDADGLEGEWLVRAVRAAPVRFGKTAVARWYLRRGDTARAGAALRGVDDATAPPELRLLRAELLVRGGDFVAALDELDRVGDAPQLEARAFELRVEALIGADRTAELDQVVRRMLVAVSPGAREMLTVTDRLLTAGRVDLATAIVERLDASEATRTPAFYERRIVADLLASGRLGTARARESILRAEPYLGNGVPEIGSILLAVQERDWTLLRSETERLGTTTFVPGPYQATAIALLGERLEAGRSTAKERLARNPRDASWAMLSGAADLMVDREVELPPWFGPSAAADLGRLMRGIEQRRARDPREALCVLLMGNDPTWHPYAKALTRAIIEDSRSEIWAPWLRLQLLLARGEVEEASVINQAILAAHPRFGPAHDLAVRLAEQRHPTDPLHPTVVSARTRRVSQMTAPLVADEIEIQMAIAGNEAQEGRYAYAAEVMKPVIRAGGPSEAVGRLMLSVFELRAGEPAMAARHLKDAAMGEIGEYREVAVDTVLAAVRRAITLDGPKRMPRAEALGILDDLAARYPLDPLVALERLRLQDVSEGEQGARAKGILKAIRQQAKETPLDELREGSTAAWVRFLTPIATEVAEALVESELELDPGNLGLLALAGAVAEHVGDTDTARANYETLLAIDPRPETGYALARILIEQGSGNDEIKRVLEDANRRQGGGSARATYLTSVYDLRLANPPFQSLIPRLGGLWDQRASSRNEVASLDLGLLYVAALMRRGEDEDLERVIELSGEIAPLLDGTFYEGTLLDAITGIARTELASR